ncbi:hypothetical protein CEXT_585411 [Caerostris extrusa]|uniref:Uncharacterized protein n=1 Tax=Caerostris extrusa TaxID=172846 RepID=A0AAV4PKD5_CAEEX|nr:hypothetical protein CEXT_585411 [Caerostris extrusa]
MLRQTVHSHLKFFRAQIPTLSDFLQSDSLSERQPSSDLAFCHNSADSKWWNSFDSHALDSFPCYFVDLQLVLLRVFLLVALCQLRLNTADSVMSQWHWLPSSPYLVDISLFSAVTASSAQSHRCARLIQSRCSASPTPS